MSNSLSQTKLVILDRDGVINEDSDQYIKSPDEWKPITGSLEAIAKLNAEVHRIMKAPDVTEQMKSRAIEVWISTPEELADYYRKEVTRWANVVKTSHIKAE